MFAQACAPKEPFRQVFFVTLWRVSSAPKRNQAVGWHAVTVLKIPILESDRIRLEPLSRSHSRGMFDLWCEPAVCEYAGPSVDAAGQPIELPARTRLESDRLLQYWLERSQESPAFSEKSLSRFH